MDHAIPAIYLCRKRSAGTVCISNPERISPSDSRAGKGPRERRGRARSNVASADKQSSREDAALWVHRKPSAPQTGSSVVSEA